MKAISKKLNLFIQKYPTWTIDRIGRLIAGCSSLCFVICSLVISPYFLIVVLLVNLNLVITSFTDKCILRDSLKGLGFKEREQIYQSNGALKSEKFTLETVKVLPERFHHA